MPLHFLLKFSTEALENLVLFWWKKEACILFAENASGSNCEKFYDKLKQLGSAYFFCQKELVDKSFLLLISTGK